LKLLFVGKTNFQYNRDLVLLNGLKKREDVEIEIFQIKKRNWTTFKEIRNASKNYDFVIVPSFRHKDVGFVKLASMAAVVFDPLISKYMTRVLDYGVKWKAPHKFLVDWLAFTYPDILIWDTKSHQNYLKKKYRLTKPMKPIYIGADTDIFFPISKSNNDKFIIGFYGSFNPLQGIDRIVRAAHLLKDHAAIQFRIIGSGSTYKSVRTLADKLRVINIDFLPNVPYTKLNEAINEFDLCLGVFGESYKTDVVIPNKIYHYAAAQKCIITKDTIGVRELFAHDQNAFLVKNDPSAISEAILTLKSDMAKREQLAQNAYSLIANNYNHHKIAEQFVTFLRTCSSNG